MSVEFLIQYRPRLGALSNLVNGLVKIAQETQAEPLALLLVIRRRPDELLLGIGVVDQVAHLSALRAAVMTCA